MVKDLGWVSTTALEAPIVAGTEAEITFRENSVTVVVGVKMAP